METLDQNWQPENIEPEIGKQLQTEFRDGTPIMAVITSFTDSTLTLDANHPLVGQTQACAGPCVEYIPEATRRCASLQSAPRAFARRI